MLRRSEPRERHPLPDDPPWSLEDRVRHLEMHLAMLWDEVWWHQLPFWRRWLYALQGFRSPIDRFYGREVPPWRQRTGT